MSFPEPPTRAALACFVLAATLLSGCDLNTQAAKEQDSILALIPSPPDPATAARWSIDTYDADKRYRGTALLANAPFGGEEVYRKIYEQHLTDPDSSVRAIAAYALGLHGNPEHVPQLIPLLKDPDRLVRRNTVFALQRLHNPAAAAPLCEHLDPLIEPEVDIRAEAATALGQYADIKVLSPLMTALGDDRLSVTRAAANSLKTLTGQPFGDDRRAWVEWFGKTSDPFAGRGTYVYPIFTRDKVWWEYMPFTPDPPNEVSAPPVGMDTPGKG